MDAGRREDKGDVAAGDAQAGTERGGERADPGEEGGEGDGLASCGVDEGRAGGERSG